MSLLMRRMMMAIGMEDEEVKEWKLLRSITVPETIDSDSGINWVEQANGGFLFGFDTDDDGNSFSVDELFVRYEASTTNSASINNVFRIRLDTAIPKYITSDNTWIIGVPTSFGKSGSRIYGWFKCERIVNRIQAYGAYNTGASYPNQLAARDAPFKERIEKISVLLANYNGYGFESGSTFEIYGR